MKTKTPLKGVLVLFIPATINRYLGVHMSGHIFILAAGTVCSPETEYRYNNTDNYEIDHHSADAHPQER